LQKTWIQSREMNIVNYRSVLALFTCCVAVLLLSVDGQSTIDEVDECETSRDVAIAEMRAEMAKLKGQLATMSTVKPGASKFSAFTVHSCFCDLCYDLFHLGLSSLTLLCGLYRTSCRRLCTKTHTFILK